MHPPGTCGSAAARLNSLLCWGTPAPGETCRLLGCVLCTLGRVLGVLGCVLCALGRVLGVLGVLGPGDSAGVRDRRRAAAASSRALKAAALRAACRSDHDEEGAWEGNDLEIGEGPG